MRDSLAVISHQFQGKMKSLFLLLFIVGSIQAKECLFGIQFPDKSMFMGDTNSILFSIEIPKNTNSSSIKLSVTNNNENIIFTSVPKYYPDEIINDKWNGTVNITGIFIGKATISLNLTTDQGNCNSEDMEIIVTRPHRIIDTLFTASIAILVSILYINFGCAMDWSLCKETLKKPTGVAIGAFCQFIIMPLIGYGVGQIIFPDRPEMQIGIFFTGISPSGGASNIWTVLLGGNINLSVTMTTFGTIASFATIPFWIFTLGKHIFEKSNLGIPYRNIGFLAVGLVIPLALGYLIQKKFPKLSRILVRILKPFSVVLIVFIIVFAIVTNMYLFKLFSWEIVLAGAGLAWTGYICGFLTMLIFKQPHPDVKAIAIETGIQNTGIAIFLLRFSLVQPEADLTTVIPVSCAVMTPIPLTVLWLIKLIFARRKKKLAASMEKLRKIPEPVNAIATTNSPTVLH